MDSEPKLYLLVLVRSLRANRNPHRISTRRLSLENALTANANAERFAEASG
jgi:hypothetical protein